MRKKRDLREARPPPGGLCFGRAAKGLQFARDATDLIGEAAVGFAEPEPAFHRIRTENAR